MSLQIVIDMRVVRTFSLCLLELSFYSFLMFVISFVHRFIVTQLVHCRMLYRMLADSTVVEVTLSTDIEEILQNLAHTSLLEELYFWSIKYEFPQKLVTFMLSLLPNDQFKVSTVECWWWFICVLLRTKCYILSTWGSLLGKAQAYAKLK